MPIIERKAPNFEANAILVAEAFDSYGIRLIAIIPPCAETDYQWSIIGQSDTIDYEAVDEAINDLIGE